MMTSLRKHMKFFLWFSIITFVGYIFLQWGMNFAGRASQGTFQAGILAQVNGEEISVTEYQNLLNSNLDAERQRQGLELDGKTLFDVEAATYDQIIRDHLVRQVLREREVRITDEEVVNVIRFQPPPELLNDTLLQTDGRFDPQKYQSILQSPQNLSWLIQYERVIRQLLPRQKLDLEIASLARTTQGEVERAMEVRKGRVKIRTLFFNPRELQSDLVGPPATESELQAYYEVHKEDFLEPEKVRLQYLIVPREPSSEDEAAVRRDIEDFLQEIREGKDFGELAEGFSEDPDSKDIGGDLGYLKKGQMEPSLEEAIASLKPGEISEPVRSSLGWHLLKVEKRRRGETKVRHLLLRVRASFETLANIEDMARAFRQEVNQMDFEKAAETYGLQVRETPPFARIGDLIPGIGFSSKISQFAFDGNPGEINGPIEVREGFYVIKLIERIPEVLPPIEEVKTLVSALLSEERRRGKTREKAEEVLQEVRGGKSLREAYKSRDTKNKSLMLIEETPFVTLFENEQNLPIEIFGASYALDVGVVSGVVETDRGFYLVELLAREGVEPDSLIAVTQ
ncbi:peptidyl-prolyl cis-trans isomerase, partial [candidate division TA06 bacterium]|nr:peptidyl-prolyl cis-trans isomerase [candidate division TA06 bacterium]